MDALEILMALGAPAGRANPYPHYAALHELGEAVRPAPGMVIVVGYDAINSVLRDPDFRAGDEASWERNFPAWREQPVMVQGADWLLNINGPRHARIRSLIARAFTARRVAGLEPAIAAIADGLLDVMAARGADGSAVEFMHEFAYLLPVTVICELLGIPESDREEFRPLARDLTGIFEFSDPESLPVINAAAIDLLAYFTGLAATRRAEPRDDLVSDLLAVSDRGDGRLTDAELLHNLTLLLVAGFETTTNLLGNGVLALLRNPGELALLQQDPSLVRGAVEELLRYDSPLQFAARLAREDVELDGRTLRAGQRAVLLLGSANHDPAEFSDPDRLDVRRQDQRHVAFGFGMHFCLGAGLARAEAQIALDTLVRRLPGIALGADPPVRRPSIALRGLSSLPVEFEPRRAH